MGRLQRYLKAIGRFQRYSLHNAMLIASQRPNASYVAGFQTWNELGRFVKKGEKGILILAPILRRKPGDEKDNEERPVLDCWFSGSLRVQKNNYSTRDIDCRIPLRPFRFRHEIQLTIAL